MPSFFIPSDAAANAALPKGFCPVIDCGADAAESKSWNDLPQALLILAAPLCTRQAAWVDCVTTTVCVQWPLAFIPPQAAEAAQVLSFALVSLDHGFAADETRAMASWAFDRNGQFVGRSRS